MLVSISCIIIRNFTTVISFLGLLPTETLDLINKESGVLLQFVLSEYVVLVRRPLVLSLYLALLVLQKTFALCS